MEDCRMASCKSLPCSCNPPSASARYAFLCSSLSGHGNSVSSFGGNSAATSFFILRKTKGVTCRRRSCNVLDESSVRHFSNSFRAPSNPGIRNLKIVHKSRAEFSIGVPERASRWWASIDRQAWVTLAFGFLINCASSSTA